MTFQQELTSWMSPQARTTAEPVQIGQKAPDTPQLQLQPGKQTVVAFLRHCGCPWAEKTYLELRKTAKSHADIDFIAVSHSDEASTEKWRKSLPEPSTEPSNLRLVIDDKVETYAAWGLGISGWLHALSPGQLWNVYKSGQVGLNVRPTESGSRWQASGWYAIDEQGIVRWGNAASRADDVPDFEKAVESLGKPAAKL